MTMTQMISPDAAGALRIVGQLLESLDQIIAGWDTPFGLGNEDETFELLSRWGDWAVDSLSTILLGNEAQRAAGRLSRVVGYSDDGNPLFFYSGCRSYLVGLRFALERNPGIVSQSPSRASDDLSDDELLRKLDELHEIMVNVATGGPRIDMVNVHAKELLRALDIELTKRGIENPIPYSDLWAWYARWSQPDLASYRSRRVFLADLFGSVQKRIELTGPNAPRTAEPTGWARVDRCTVRIRKALQTARTEEEFQGVGHLCREALISLAENVYDPTLHPTIDGVEPSVTDAKRRLEAYINAALPGASNEAARRHTRSAISLADALQHDRTASYIDAALCQEATTAVVNMVGIVAGRRTSTS